MHDILAKLAGGDLRSIGRVPEVIEEVLATPSLFAALFAGVLGDDAVIRMRAADAIEKITIQHPEYLQPYKAILIEQVAGIDQQEVRWHFAQMASRLDLSAQERAKVVVILIGYLEDHSKIVKTMAMQALADLAQGDPKLKARVITLLETLVENGSPAMRSRGRQLLKRLKARR